MSQANEARQCPICSRAQVAEFRPFCSRRCAGVDLGRWLGGGYAIPAVEDEDGSAAPGGSDEGEGGGL